MSNFCMLVLYLIFIIFRLSRNLKSSICGFEDNPISGRVKLVHKGA